MGNEYRGKVFKSGNSLAIRFPKVMGLVEGDEMVVVPHADGTFTMWKADQALAVFMSLYGSMSPGFMADGRGDIEQEPRDWSRPADTAAAA